MGVIASNTSTALRYAQHDSAHSGHGPVCIWQRRFFAWKTRGWCGCGTGTALLLLSSLGFEAGGVWKGSEGRDEDGDGGGDASEGGSRRGEGRAGWCFGEENEKEEEELWSLGRAVGMDDGACCVVVEGGGRFAEAVRR